MELHELPKITKKSKKRVGRGYGSGKGGHTVGRGQKGQKVRGKIGLLFEGTKFRKSLIKRLPLLRGKGKLKPGKKPLIVNLKYLNLLPSNSLVDVKTLAKSGIVNLEEAKEFGVKILGEGKLGVALKIALPCSKGAVEKIKKAGGEVIKLKVKSVPRSGIPLRGKKLEMKREKKEVEEEKSAKIRQKSVESKRPVRLVKAKKAKTKGE